MQTFVGRGYGACAAGTVGGIAAWCFRDVEAVDYFAASACDLGECGGELDRLEGAHLQPPVHDDHCEYRDERDDRHDRGGLLVPSDHKRRCQ